VQITSEKNFFVAALVSLPLNFSHCEKSVPTSREVSFLKNLRFCSVFIERDTSLLFVALSRDSAARADNK
jgi:hypothetical protein